MNTIESTPPVPGRGSNSSSGTATVKKTAPAVQAERPAPAQPPPEPGRASGTPPPTEAVAAEEPGPDSRKVDDAVDRLNGLMQSIRRELHFTVDDESGRTIIKVIDSETKMVVREIPPGQVFDIIENLQASNAGLMGGFKV